MIRDIIESERTSGHFGWQERLHGHIEGAFVNEGASMNGGAETHLLTILRYYLGLNAGRPPRVTRFQPARHLPEIAARISYLDVMPESPAAFAWINHQPSPFPGLGHELAGMRLIDHPSRVNAQSCAAEYHRCRIQRTPEYALIDQSLNADAGPCLSIRRAFYRVMLPLTNPQGRVVRIAYSFRRVAVAPAGLV